MRPTTIRLRDDLSDELDAEYAEYGYSSRSEYIRAIIEHRDPPFPNTATTSDYAAPTTDDYERLRDRVDELEDRVADLEERRSTPATTETAEPAEIEPREAGSEPVEPQGLYGEEAAVEWLRQHGPARRSEIVSQFADAWEEAGIKGDSWWRRHAMPALEKAGAEYNRGVGWRINE